MKYNYNTVMHGGKNISQRDAYGAAMNAAVRGTKVYGLIPSKHKSPVNQKLSKGRKEIFKNRATK